LHEHHGRQAAGKVDRREALHAADAQRVGRAAGLRSRDQASGHRSSKWRRSANSPRLPVLNEATGRW
jgi:hypothetical protein